MKVLFLCTHNRCRSIFAEAIFNHLAPEGVSGLSAGSEPAGQPHPKTISTLQKHGIATGGLASKSWDDLADLQPDIVITVCDKAAGEACPLFFGQALKAHWGMADPSQVIGSEAEIKDAFEAVYKAFSERLSALVERLRENPAQEQLQQTLNNLGAH